LVYSLYYYCIF